MFMEEEYADPNDSRESWLDSLNKRDKIFL